jgi:hypothetical protein
MTLRDATPVVGGNPSVAGRQATHPRGLATADAYRWLLTLLLSVRIGRPVGTWLARRPVLRPRERLSDMNAAVLFIGKQVLRRSQSRDLVKKSGI